MKPIDFIFQIVLAELAQRIAEAPESEFDTEGRFVPVAVKGRRYWYFDWRGARGGKVRKYVGPDDNETVRRTVAQFREQKDDASARRKIVRTLTREANLPAPDPFVGKIIRSLSEAGLFRGACVLLEQNAYRCFAANLGVELPRVSWGSKQTGISLSIHAASDIVTVRDILRSADQSFTPESATGVRQGDVSLVNNDGFRIALVAPTLLTAYLVEDPAKSVMLYKSGIEVMIPRPERFAIHELMMSARAGEEISIQERDFSRARALVVMEALLSVRRQADLAEAYEAAWNRNDTWRGLIERGLVLIDDTSVRARILEGLAHGMKDIGCDPAHVQ